MGLSPGSWCGECRINDEEVIQMKWVGQMERSTVNLIGAVFWGAGALAWLPRPSADVVDLSGMIFSVLCAAAFVRQMFQYFSGRKAERRGTV